MRIQSSIVVKYHGPTNCRGARWIAKTARWADRVTTSYDFGISTKENILKAAQAYIDRFGMKVEIQSIVEIDENSYAVAIG